MNRNFKKILLDKYIPEGSILSKGEHNIIDFALGKSTCKETHTHMVIHFLLLPVVVIITYLILLYFSVYLSKYFTNFYVVLFNVLILFLVVYLIEQWLHNYRKKNPSCTPSWWK
jgi:hypothetical protein